MFGFTADATGFLSEWLQRSGREKSFVIDSGSGILRDYIHIADTLHCLRAIAGQSACGIFNVASGMNVSNTEIADVFKRRGWTISMSRETARQALPVCDVAPLRALGVTPRDPLAIIDEWLESEGTK